MAMPAIDRLWTVEEVLALPEDGNRYEVIDGALLVTPAPSWTHGEATLELVRRLDPWLRETGAGHLKIAPQDIVYDARTMVEPDLFVVPLVDGRRPRTWEEAGRLLLAIEIVSPSTARADRVAKRRLYQSRGVPEYWIVDVDARLVERWRPADERPEIVAEVLLWLPDPARPPLQIELPAYFRDVLGES